MSVRGFLNRHRRVVAMLSFVGVLAVGGTAWAYMTSAGSGHGSGSTASMSTVTLNATAGSPSTPLYPGGTADVSLELNNPNGYAVTLRSVTAHGTITADAGHTGCTTTGVTFTSQTGLTTSIPANANGDRIDLASAVTMSSSSSNGCQGSTFSIPVTITVQK